MSGLQKAHGFVAHSTEDGFFKMTLEDCHALNRELRMLYESRRDLLEAFQEIKSFMGADFDDIPISAKGRAAIAKATGEGA